MSDKDERDLLEDEEYIGEEESGNERVTTIPEWQSGCRFLYCAQEGVEYRPLESLEEARKHDDAYLVMEGDYGGQVYLTAPIQEVKCDLSTLESLLQQIDLREWDEEDGTGIFFERMDIGDYVAGGMGGGYADDRLWVHEHLKYFTEMIANVLAGRSTSILD